MIIPFIWPWGQSQGGAQVNADWNAASGPAQILNKPSIPAAQQPADWSASTGVTRILNKPALFSGNYADLAGKPALFSGAYADLTGKPVLFSGAYADLTGKPALSAVAISGAYADLSGRPSLAAVATSGAYADLSGKPSIPAAQVQSDWNATVGLGVILNKPAIPTVKRTETYTGSTDANGLITVTYPTAFAVVPNVQPGPPPSSDMSWILVSSTTSGFSLRLVQRAVLTVLSLQVLAGTVTNVVGSPARVLVVES